MKRKQILLVEDCLSLAVSWMRVLQKAGYDVLHMFNGEDAVELISKGAIIDLILMDIDLGDGICGITATRRILCFRDIPVVFFTSYSEKEVKQLAGDFCRYTYLSKISPAYMLHFTLEKILTATQNI